MPSCAQVVESWKDIDRDALLADFSANFIKLLEEYGITQTEAANKCHIDRQTLHKMVAGVYNPSLVYLKFISNNTKIPFLRLVAFIDSLPYEKEGYSLAAEPKAKYKKKK